MPWHDYMALFLVGGAGGWLFEMMQGTQEKERFLERIGLGKVPFLPMYGIGLSLMYAAYQVNSSLGLLSLALVCAVMFTLFECIVGQLNEQLFGARGWTYTTYDAFCTHYNSIRVSL